MARERQFSLTPGVRNYTIYSPPLVYVCVYYIAPYIRIVQKIQCQLVQCVCAHCAQLSRRSGLNSVCVCVCGIFRKKEGKNKTAKLPSQHRKPF